MEYKNINIRNLYIDLLNKIKNVEGVDKDYVDGLIQVIDYHLTALDTDLSAIESVIPDDASISNPLITADDIPAQVNADWNATSGPAVILNKPSIPSAQVNSDWNATSGVAQILNKPDLMSMDSVVTTISSSGWTQPTGETYYYKDIPGVFISDPAGDFFIFPGGTAPGVPYPAAEAAAYALVYDARTVKSGSNIIVRLYASAEPQSSFTVRFIIFI